ncbi:MAG: hypothetical protein HOI53_02700 [Francisellaceae bacterium]|jgi:hypothetical protein|nr:hypothetical protein [Francisellaceae bacterium]MBT6206913.1 hypothetical protein [Francisellaceae bacterium]MBT6539169.1 hypothetical protein [Francisellaceae bacterium]
MNKKKNKLETLALKFFIPACAVMLWYPSVSAAESKPVESVISQPVKNSGLRDTEIMMIKLIHERRMLEEYTKSQKEIARELSKHRDINSDTFMTDINGYNEFAKIRRV